MIDAIWKQVARLDPENLEVDTDPEGIYIPSREEIARRCAEIQRTWSPREHRKRASEPKRPRWMPPVIHLQADVQSQLRD